MLIVQVMATFPMEPIALEGVNVTETLGVGEVKDCEVTENKSGGRNQCGLKGTLTEGGIVALNMW